MKCADIMTLNPIMCVPNDNVSIAMDIMWDYDCGAIPVVKDMESKELVGIVTDRDIAMCVVKYRNAHPSEIKVIDCMSSPVFSCGKEDSVEAVIQMMGEHQVRRIPVVDEHNCCIGIISQADIVANWTDAMSVIDLFQQISAPYKGSSMKLSEHVSSAVAISA